MRAVKIATRAAEACSDGLRPPGGRHGKLRTVRECLLERRSMVIRRKTYIRQRDDAATAPFKLTFTLVQAYYDASNVLAS